MFYLGLIVIAGFVIRDLLLRRDRAKQIRHCAENASLTYIGAALPKSFPFSQTSVSLASSITNAVAGKKNGKELLVFDCRLGAGKGRRSLTVLAIRGAADGFRAAPFGWNLTMETVDEWTLIYRTRSFFSFSGLLPPEEIEALLSGV